MGHGTFQAGDLTAVIGDNEAYEGQRAGYNGIHRLAHRSQPATLFVPGVSGLNLEHIFDGDQDLRNLSGNRKIFFEPRNAPMEFRRISETEAELHQPQTPTFFLESWTRFKLVAPHYVDFSFRCKPHQHAFRHGYIGLFWASYIHGPENKSIYFKDDRTWHQFCTQAHDNQSTVRHKDDAVDLKFTPVEEQTLYKNLSALRFAEPLYYGYSGALQYILMFDRAEGIRFAHSPTGGGANNPAWDWQYILPKYEVLQEYGFRARVAYRERISRDEVLKEYHAWRESLK